MEKMTDCNVGIDVSKSCLDAYRLEDEVAARFDNSPSGFRALMKWLGTRPVAKSCMSRRGLITGRWNKLWAGNFRW